MEVWQIVLYGSAAYLTVQLLMRLMESHKLRRLNELAEEYHRLNPSPRSSKTKKKTAKPAAEAAGDQKQAA